MCEFSELYENCFRAHCLSVAMWVRVVLDSDTSNSVWHFVIRVYSGYFPGSYVYIVPGPLSFVELYSFIFASLLFRYFPADISTISLCIHPVFSVLPQSTIYAKTLSTLLVFVYLLCCACRLTSIYLRRVSLSGRLCSVNDARDHKVDRSRLLRYYSRFP